MITWVPSVMSRAPFGVRRRRCAGSLSALPRAVLSAFVFVMVIAPGLASAQIQQEPVQPIPKRIDHDPKKAELGRALFFDKRLSADSSVSCASCHNPAKGGADGLTTSVGIHGKAGAINAPSVLNAAFNFRQFWDGRARSLVEQADGPVNNPLEMGTNWPDVVQRLSADPAFKSAFEQVYPTGVKAENLRGALDHFQRTLITPGARVDRYLAGQTDAITATELRGYQLFKSYGCVACHQGVNFGGNMFQRFGAIGDYFKDRGGIKPADLGRFNVTKQESDRHFFKVPSLRNVALTAPYFHDGSAKTLSDAIDVMFKYQLGRSAPPADKSDINAFLQTLTADLPANFKP